MGMECTVEMNYYIIDFFIGFSEISFQAHAFLKLIVCKFISNFGLSCLISLHSNINTIRLLAVPYHFFPWYILFYSLYTTLVHVRIFEITSNIQGAYKLIIKWQNNKVKGWSYLQNHFFHKSREKDCSGKSFINYMHNLWRSTCISLIIRDLCWGFYLTFMYVH